MKILFDSASSPHNCYFHFSLIRLSSSENSRIMNLTLYRTLSSL